MLRLGLLSCLLAASSVMADITCLSPGQLATARFVNAAGQTCTWTGTVGVNFGVNPINGRRYDCNGRCGAGCSGLAINDFWTQDCFSHDICSWFYGATGGAGDPNCGKAFKAAEDDTILGGVNQCVHENPKVGVTRPNTRPVCTGGRAGNKELKDGGSWNGTASR